MFRMNRYASKRSLKAICGLLVIFALFGCAFYFAETLVGWIARDASLMLDGLHDSSSLPDDASLMTPVFWTFDGIPEHTRKRLIEVANENGWDTKMDSVDNRAEMAIDLYDQGYVVRSAPLWEIVQQSVIPVVKGTKMAS
jgi:hypothetical protein